MDRNCCLRKYSCVFHYSSSLTILCLNVMYSKILKVDGTGFSPENVEIAVLGFVKFLISSYAVMHHLLFSKM